MIKKLALLLALIFVTVAITPVTHAEIVDKNRPAYVWFSKCVDEKDLDCIESLGIVDETGKFIPGHPTGFSHPDVSGGSVENKTKGFLDYVWTHPNETWELPGLKTEYGNGYVVTEFSLITGVGRWYDPISNTIFPPGKTNHMRFALLAAPTIQGFAGNLWGIPLQNFDHQCVTQDYTQAMVCQRTANFPAEQEIRATLRFSWYRASQVQSNLRENGYEVEELGNGSTRVTVSGKPMERPYFVDSPSLNRDIYTREKADTVTNHWEIQTHDSVDGYTPDKCKDLGLPIVTGNMFSQSPPSWDANTGDLSVNVWAPHLDPNGNPYKGYYEGNFSAAYISCLWGIDSKKISYEFSLSVIDQGAGGNEVMTTSIMQTSTGVRLVASGFHYSNEKIKFHRREATPSPSATPITTPTLYPSVSAPASAKPNVTPVIALATNKATITCIKGKTVRKVTGIKPTCPKGYKKSN